MSAFDERRGLGTITDAAGGTWPFHCTAILDGSRTIAVGTTVSFCLAPGHLGRMEARFVEAEGAGTTA